MSTPATTPPPGSAEAVAQGCTCPVIDNGRGKGFMGMAGVYVFNGECLLHGEQVPPATETTDPAPHDNR